MSRAPEIKRWEWISLPVLGTLFVAIRFPLYRGDGLVLGWNSDAALWGLMARAMRDGIDHPVFFWGQPYLGTFTSMLTLAVSAIGGIRIGPLALRIAAALQVYIGTLFFWSALRRMFGREAAMLTAAWLTAGPVFLFAFTIASNSEQLYLLCAIVLWYAAGADFTRPAEWFVAGLLCGFAMWVHQFVVFVIAAVAAALFIERLRISVKAIVSFAIGALIGYLPAIIAVLRHDPVLYRRAINDWTFERVAGNLRDTLQGDLWLLLTDATRPGIVTGIVIVIFAATGLRHASQTRALNIALLTVAFSFAFRIWTSYPYPGAVRYISAVTPVLYGAAAYGILRMKRPAAIAASLAIGLALFVPRAMDVRAVLAARAERFTNWPSDFDPRPTLAALREGGYRVCYGEVWVAHKLEWISDPVVRFVPVRSVHRTLPLSLHLIREPGVNCYVDNDGHVTRLSEEKAAHWRETVVQRARRAGL